MNLYKVTYVEWDGWDYVVTESIRDIERVVNSVHHIPRLRVESMRLVAGDAESLPGLILEKEEEL